MSEYRPEEDDYIAFSNDDLFIVWNGSATFTIYERIRSSGKVLDVFTNYNVDGHDEAQGVAYDWIKDYQRTIDGF